MIDAVMYLYNRGRVALTGRDEGATMVEYVLVIVAIALIAVVGAAVLGGDLDQSFEDIGDEVGVP